MKYSTRLEFFQNGDNLRVIEMYSSSEYFLKHRNELIGAEEGKLMEYIEMTSVSIYGSVLVEVK